MNKKLTVLEAKRYGTFNCRPDTSLLKVSRKMVEEDISALVIVDEDGYLAGIISRTDLLRAYLTHDEWATQPVSHFMTREVVTVTPDTPLLEAAELVLNSHIHRVVVVRQENGKPQPIAVVSDSDLLYHMVKES